MINSIDLSNNNLHHLNNNDNNEIFENFKNLIEIDLSYNYLTEIGNFNTRINKLNISHNKITSDKLYNLPKNLKYLDLSYNKITYLPLQLKNLKNLRSIELIGNEIECSCETLEVRNWLQYNHVWTDNRVKCASPIDVKDKSWLQVRQLDVCGNHKIIHNTESIDNKKHNNDNDATNDLMLGDEPIDGDKVNGSGDAEYIDELGKDFILIEKNKNFKILSSLEVEEENEQSDEPTFDETEKYTEEHTSPLTAANHKENDDENIEGSGGIDDQSIELSTTSLFSSTPILNEDSIDDQNLEINNNSMSQSTITPNEDSVDILNTEIYNASLSPLMFNSSEEVIDDQSIELNNTFLASSPTSENENVTKLEEEYDDEYEDEDNDETTKCANAEGVAMICPKNKEEFEASGDGINVALNNYDDHSSTTESTIDNYDNDNLTNQELSEEESKEDDYEYQSSTLSSTNESPTEIFGDGLGIVQFQQPTESTSTIGPDVSTTEFVEGKMIFKESDRSESIHQKEYGSHFTTEGQNIKTNDDIKTANIQFPSKSFEDESLGGHKMAYILLATVVVLLVALIIYVAFNRAENGCRNRSRNNLDLENQKETELIDMNKSNLDKSVHKNGTSVEHTPLIGHRTNSDNAKPMNGANGRKPSSPTYDKKNKNDVQEPLLNSHDVELVTPKSSTSESPQTKVSPLSAESNNNTSPLPIPSQKSMPVSDNNNKNIEETPNNSYKYSPIQKHSGIADSGDEAMDNTGIINNNLRASLSRYSPVYSPETGRVKIKLLETPHPNTPILVTRSRSKAGDIITTPTIAVEVYNQEEAPSALSNPTPSHSKDIGAQ